MVCSTVLYHLYNINSLRKITRFNFAGNHLLPLSIPVSPGRMDYTSCRYKSFRYWTPWYIPSLADAAVTNVGRTVVARCFSKSTTVTGLYLNRPIIVNYLQAVKSFLHLNAGIYIGK